MLIIVCLVVCSRQTGFGNAGDTAGRPLRADRADFAWGVNGHPLSQEAYRGNIDSQIAVIKALGLSYYRIDMAHYSNGVIDSTEAERFFRLRQLASQRAVTLVPIIFLPDAKAIYELDSATAYEKGRAVGQGFAHNYKSYFHYYELGNEYDIDVLKKPEGDGSDTSHYDMGRFKILASALRGMSDGVKQEDTGCRVIISNAGWMHYAYFQLLEQAGVRFDIIGYHWYEDVRHLRTVLEALNMYFPAKPVWFTEINARNDGVGYSYRHQRARVRKYLKVIRRRGRTVSGFFTYELFDEPANPTSKERSYGLVSWKEPYKTYAFKPLALFIRWWTRRR